MEPTENQKVVFEKSIEIIKKTGLILTPEEIEGMEIADFGLNEIEISGAQIITIVNTDQIAVKILIMLPYQTEPEHAHLAIGEYNGKEETIRCEWGELYLYSPGEPTPDPKAKPPANRRETYAVWKEDIFKPRVSGKKVT